MDGKVEIKERRSFKDSPAFDFLQKLGKVLMVVIAVMPAAGIMISIGKLFPAFGVEAAWLLRIGTIIENVGWAKDNRECIYNIFMMEECHTILSCGGGAVTKLKAPKGDEIERIFNFKYPFEYIRGFQELIERKKRITEFYSTYSL